MKTLILIMALVSSFNILACKNTVPESEAQRYIDAAPIGVPGLYECKDKPDEACLCFDHIEGWDLVDVVEDEFTGKKVLRENPAKKAAYLAKIESDKVKDKADKELEVKIQAKLRELAIKEIEKESKP